jgi:hypothetical protein
MRNIFHTVSIAKTAALILLFLISGIHHAASAQDDISLSATLSTTTLSIDSTAYLTVTVNGAGSADIRIPDVENLIFHRAGQSSKTQIINTTISSSITYTFVVQPLAVGRFNIPAFEVHAKNETLITEPLSFEVIGKSKGSAVSAGPAPKGGDSGENAFITVEGLKDKAYAGEMIPIEIRAYFRQGIRAEIQKHPEIAGDGFVLSPFANEPRQTVESHNGKNYSVITWQSAVSPIKEGEHDVRINLGATLLVPKKNSRTPFNSHPLFGDDVFDGFFGSIEKKEVQLSNSERSLTILPLPQQGKPENFGGAVGKFEFERVVAPTNVEVGDPLTLTMTISGNGNFDRVSAPQFPAGDDWKTYSPTSRFENSGRNYLGKKIFEQAIVAENTRVTALPSLSFSYFDPYLREYVTRTTAALPLTVRAGAALQTPSPAAPATQQAAIPTQENRNAPAVQIRLEAGNFSTEIIPVFQRSWFIVTLIICTFLLLATAVHTLRKNHLQNNSGRLLEKRLNKDLSARLSVLRQVIETDDEDAFLRSCREIIQARLALPWKMTPAAITLRDLQKRIPDSALIPLFSTAEKHVYGKVHLSSEEMKTYYDVLKKELETMS